MDGNKLAERGIEIVKRIALGPVDEIVGFIDRKRRKIRQIDRIVRHEGLEQVPMLRRANCGQRIGRE